MKYDIRCKFHNENKRSWEVTTDGRVWPCYAFVYAWDIRNNLGTLTNEEPQTELLLQDEELSNMIENDPNWNSLEHHSLDEIKSHTYYWTKIWYPGWTSDNPNPLCVYECNIGNEDGT